MTDIAKRLREIHQVPGFHEDDFLLEAANEIERLRERCHHITPDMIAAGVFAAKDYTLGQDLSDLVVSVFSIMTAAAHQNR